MAADGESLVLRTVFHRTQACADTALLECAHHNGMCLSNLTSGHRTRFFVTEDTVTQGKLLPTDLSWSGETSLNRVQPEGAVCQLALQLIRLVGSEVIEEIVI